MTAPSLSASSLDAERNGIRIRARRKVRVLFLNDTARNGGPGRSLHTILSFLDPEVVHRVVALPREGAISRLLTSAGAADEIHFLPGLVENPIEPWDRPMARRDFEAPAAVRAARLAFNSLRAARGLAHLAALVRSTSADLVYCNGTTADFAGGALSSVTSTPSLWHVRYTSVPAALRAVHRGLSARPGVRRIVCVSGAAARLFEHCRGKVAVVSNAVDLAAFDPRRVRGTLRAELGIAADAILFGSHGRVLRRKGYIEMIRAARIALDSLGERDASRVHFAVIGDTPEDFRPDHVAECRELVSALHMDGRFFLLGFRTDVRPLVVDFDVAVVPSVYADPLPRAALEAMALGRPVVAFDVGGVREMVEHAVTGELVPFEPAQGGAPGASGRCIERLAGALVRQARDPDLRAGLGRAGRLAAERRFDARDHARRIEREIVVASGLSAEAGP